MAGDIAHLDEQGRRYVQALLVELRRLHPVHNDVEGCRTCNLIRWGATRGC